MAAQKEQHSTRRQHNAKSPYQDVETADIDSYTDSKNNLAVYLSESGKGHCGIDSTYHSVETAPEDFSIMCRRRVLGSAIELMWMDCAQTRHFIGTCKAVASVRRRTKRSRAHAGCVAKHA